MRFANNRQGASLVVVLALLAVCSIILLELLTASLQQRSQTRRDLQREQTQWLLRAGTRRATIEMENSKGEVPNDVTINLPNFESAAVTFSTDADVSNGQRLKISAQIGTPKLPHQLTVLSTELTIASNNLSPNQD